MLGDEFKEKLKEDTDEMQRILSFGIESGFRSGADGAEDVFRSMLLRMTSEFLSSQLLSGFKNLFSFGSGGGGGGFLGGLFGGARASGGPVSPGKAFLVGERGPELFVPGASGTIVPNGAGGGMVFNIDARGADAGVEERIRQGVQDAVALSRAERVDSRRRGRP